VIHGSRLAIHFPMDIFDLEKKFPAIGRIKFNGINGWPLLRIILGFELARKNFKSGKALASSRVKKFSNILCSLYGWGRWLFRKKKFKYVIFTNNLEKRVHNQRYYDRLFHSTIQILGEKDGLIVNYCEGDISTLQHSYYRNVVNGDLFNYLAIIFARFVKLEISDEDRRLIEEVMKESGVRVDYENHFKQFLVHSANYKRFFNITKPEFILDGCYTYFPQVYAAKKQGIRVIEFQHGLINSQHRGYRTLLNYQGEFTADALFSFGQKSVYDLDESVYKKEQIKPVGYSYFELISKGFYDPVMIDHHEFDITVCVPVDAVVEKETIALLVSLAPLLPRVLFILNPRVSVSVEGTEHIKPYRNVIYVIAPFQVLIQQCDYDLTILSTCAYEALYFGIPNLLFDYKGYARKVFGGILSEEHSFYFTTAEELVKFFEQTKGLDKAAITKEGSLFYSEHHQEKVKRQMKLMQG
jgi:hypothetical protein